MSEPQSNRRPRSAQEFSGFRFGLSVALAVLMGAFAIWRFGQGSTIPGVICTLLLGWNAMVARTEWAKRGRRL